MPVKTFKITLLSEMKEYLPQDKRSNETKLKQLCQTSENSRLKLPAETPSFRYLKILRSCQSDVETAKPQTSSVAHSMCFIKGKSE